MKHDNKTVIIDEQTIITGDLIVCGNINKGIKFNAKTKIDKCIAHLKKNGFIKNKDFFINDSTIIVLENKASIISHYIFEILL